MTARMFAALAVSAALLTAPTAGAQPQSGRLILTIVDAATNQMVPARVEITGADGKEHVARDALPLAGECHNFEGEGDPDYYTLERTLARVTREIQNPFAGEGRWGIKKTTQFYSAGRSQIALPPGTARIRVFKGPEYRIGVEEVSIPAGAPITRTIGLSRWIDMPAKGWYSSDDHLHIARPVKEMNPLISKMMQAEDIHIANLLQMGKAKSFSLAPQYAHGPESLYREGNYLLYAGQEDPRTHVLGHTITLGSREAVHDPEAYLLYRLLWEETSRNGGINGYAHYGDHADAQFGLPVVLQHNLMTFIEVLQKNRGFYDVWYEILNLGFRITPTAGSDYPCGTDLIPGHERFYTKVEGPFTYDAWLDGVRKGRTFVTTGPLVEFRINGQDIGSEVVLQQPAAIHIEGKVLFDTQKDHFAGVELVENGVVVGSFPRTDESGEVRFELKRPVSESVWLAVRGYEELLKRRALPDSVHTSQFHSAPIYVTVESAPAFTAHPRTKAIARGWLSRLENLEERLAEKNVDALATELAQIDFDAVPREIIVKNRSALLREIETAKEFFRNLSR